MWDVFTLKAISRVCFVETWGAVGKLLDKLLRLLILQSEILTVFQYFYSWVLEAWRVCLAMSWMTVTRVITAQEDQEMYSTTSHLPRTGVEKGDIGFWRGGRALRAFWWESAALYST
jgi:hypothetical protein